MRSATPTPNPRIAADDPATALQVHAFAWYLGVVLVGVSLLWVVAQAFAPGLSTLLGVLLPVLLLFNALGLAVLWRWPSALRALQVAQYASFYPFLHGFLALMLAQADGPDAVQTAVAGFALWIPVVVTFTFFAFGTRDGLTASLAFVAATLALIIASAAQGATLDGPGVAYVATVVVASVVYAAIVYGTAKVGERLAEARVETAVAAERALRDTLTGVHSRYALEERFDQELARARRGDRPLAVYFLDLDGFKAVNDAYGHAVGDALLRAFAARIQATVRLSDTVGRVGGDEFVVLATVADRAEAHALAERMLAACVEPVVVDGASFALTVSIGVAVYPGDGDDRPALLRAADTAMYAAKASGHNRWAAHVGRRGDRAHADDGRTLATAAAASRATAASAQSATS